ncbi:MAG: YraN family protein [Candidatus Coatesbacteria bacterium]|nr:YraN family protein [Candidatus Coatesbacteria bacterium]
MSESDAKRMGRRAEELAAAEYQRRGWSVLLRNWRPRGLGLRGELDLVVRRDELLAVVEVKARRRGGPAGGAREAVDIRKRRRLARLADALLVSRPDLRGLYVRFDVAAITWEPELDRPSLELIEDAFRL